MELHIKIADMDSRPALHDIPLFDLIIQNSLLGSAGGAQGTEVRVLRGGARGTEVRVLRGAAQGAEARS